MSDGRIQWHDTLPSTIEVAHQWAAQGAPHGSAVVARIQTAGRGTRGQLWDSGAGGLWMSVIVRPDLPRVMETLSLRVGLALADALDPLLRPGIRIAVKWPNDLLIESRKVAGVLCEARWQGEQLSWALASVGVNVTNAVPLSLADRTTRLSDHGVRESAPELAERLGNVMAAASLAPPSSEELFRAFAARDWLEGRALLEPERGVATGITETGRLRIRRPDGSVVAALGTVRLDDQG